jgi:2-hydroxy-3-keto-5-methylthiopentenyl-1-phosphate phosphatase
MEKYVIQEELKNCPGIVYFPDTNILELVGRSIPENPELIFKRLDEWITTHFEKNKELNVDIKLEYINSGSSKYLYEILKRLTGFGRSGSKVIIRWLYEEDDEAMLELGEHYRDTAGIPLQIDMII